MQSCDTVVFLDYPLEVCLDGVRSRRGSARTDMPWTEAADEEDAEFIGFIERYSAESRPAVLRLLERYSEKTVLIFCRREEADAFLKTL